MPDNPPMRAARVWVLTGIGVLGAAGAFALGASLWGGRGPDAGGSTIGSSGATTTLMAVDLEVAVDESVTPAVETVPALGDDGPPRPVGRTVTDDGLASDFVVGEIVVVVPDEEALSRLGGREDVEVVDVEDDPAEEREPGEGIEALLRVHDLSAVDISRVAFDLAGIEPGMTGTLSASDDETVATLAVLGRLSREPELEVSLNDVMLPQAVADGRVVEGLSENANAFDWSFVKSTATQQIGLDTAWQMLYHEGKAVNRVVVMVVDAGFVENLDFPANSRIRKGDWGPKQDWLCTNDNPCPYHGTQVSLVMAGQHDNNWGTAGVAGPWAFLVAMPVQGGSYETLKEIRRVIREEEPDVINMSFGSVVTTSVNATRRRYDRTFRAAAKYHDTLAFASAGNEGINVDKTGDPYLPCASDQVICVGGMGVDLTEKHSSSNYGSDRDDRSVEIYGPYCVYVYADPSDGSNGTAKQGCGTSYSSPFVAGVAALLRVADPSISPGEMKAILYETAHLGDLGPLATGHLRRVDAHMAVARALGLTWTPPTVTIESGAGTYPVDEVISLAGAATSFTDEPIAIRWHSSIDGWLNQNPSINPIGATLSSGQHIIQATAIDRRGFSGVAAIEVTMENEPPVVTIVNPTDAATIYEGTALNMLAYTHDPDPFINQALDEEDVVWTITRGGTEVFTADGHAVATSLSPGEYLITLTGTDAHGATETDTVELEVLELEPGWVPPSASIIRPATDQSYGVGNNTVTVELRGLARGVDGNVISGQRFRWTASSDNGHTITICVGSGFPGASSGGGGFTIPVDCRDSIVELGLAPGAVGRTVWGVKLEAVDVYGAPVEAVREIEIVFATG